MIENEWTEAKHCGFSRLRPSDSAISNRGSEMMRNEIFISMAVGLSLVAGVVNAQVSSQGGAPTPGAGDSTRITSENRETNATYNQRMGATDLKSSNGQDRPKTNKPVKASLEDIKPGVTLRDVKGVQIGTIVSADTNQAIVDTGQTKIGVPLVGFGKDDKGLLINMTADQFNQAIAKAHAASQANATESH
jgi:hypothetical protein